VPQPTRIGPAFDGKAAQGKLIYVIEAVGSPLNTAITNEEVSAAAKVGAKVVVFPTTGSVTQYQRGVEAAIAAGADVIDLDAFDPAPIAPQLAEARAKGIKITLNYQIDPTQKFPAGFSGGSYGAASTLGEIEADYAIAATHGKLNALVLISRDIPSTATITASMDKTFQANCPNCKITYLNEPVSAWPSFNSATAAALQRDPSINYVVAAFDSFASFALGGITTAGAGNRVGLDTFGGSKDVLSLIKPNSTVQMDLGNSAAAVGLAAIDNDLRVATGQEPFSAAVNFRVWDTSNVSEAGNPPDITKGYGSDLEAPYFKAWGVS
jgi:ribose transport system substrate-binding protein